MEINIDELKQKVLNNKYEKEYLLGYIEERLKCSLCNSNQITKLMGNYYCYDCKKEFLTEQEIFENLDKYDDDTDYIRAHQDRINYQKNKYSKYNKYY